MNPGDADFLRGGGEMGERMRSFDWAATALGEPARWPQSLKTIVRVMLDSRFAMWMAWGPEGSFFCNDAYLPTVGIKREWVLGARADRVWQEIWHDIGPRIEQVLTTGHATWDAGLQLFLRRSGYDEETFHTFSYSPVYDESSRVAGMLCVVVEDTERVLNERRLGLLRSLALRSNAEAESVDAAGLRMLEALNGGRLDVPFAALYLQQRPGDGLRLVGTTARARRGELPLRAGAHASGTEAPGRLAAALASGVERCLEDLPQDIEIGGPWTESLQQALTIPLHGAGQAAPFGCLVLGVSPRRRLDEGYRSFMGLVADQFASQLTDVDSRLQAEQRAAELAELDRAKNVFFSNVSHEFRTPLTLMLGPIDNLLAGAGLDDAQRQSLELLRQNGLRLRRLVNSLLDFSRIEAGRADAHFRRTDLAALTTDLASVFRSAVEDAGLRLLVRCEALPAPAYVDVDMWEKVVLNLMSNALKFTFEGEIEVQLTAVDGQAQLQVRDTGAGIDAAALEKVFDRFHRIEGVRSRSQEGTGIGLALVRELVRLHGGNVAVQSRLGEGSCFTVRVPLGRQHLPAEQVHEGDEARRPLPDRSAYVDDALRGERTSYRNAVAAPAAAAAPAASSAFAGRRQRVLVVDDNADMRAYVQRLLAPHWEVVTACDGLAALAAIAESMPDVVVSDMMMPRLDGRSLIQRLRADPATRALPVIVLSAQAGEEARVAGLSQGADDYLVKPFSAAELQARVEVQLVRSALRQADALRHKLLTDILRNAPVGVAVMRGPTHVFEFTNPMYQQLVRDRPVVGLAVRDAMPELEGQGVYELLDGVYASGEAYRGHAFPVKLLDPASGELSQRYFEFVYQPLPDDDGAIGGIAAICMDVDELMRARTDAEAASRAKDAFIAMLGHELRNPLAPIFTALQVLKMRDGTSLPREWQIVARQAEHMARLVDDLLDVSRIARGNVELKRSTVALSEVIDKAVEMAGPLIESRQHALMLPAPGPSLAVLADPTRLAQIVANLLTNAAKFTPIGGRVEVLATRDGDDALLCVRDNGVGLRAEELETVFGLFAQGGQGLQRAEGGLGLGLAIARNLARLHGGTLSAASAGPGLGSEFTLRLPLGAAQRSEPVEPPQAAPAEVAVGARRRVLVVDDNLDAAAVLAELLALHGHEVALAADGPQALALVGEHAPFDVALLDIGLPVMSGYELAEHLRRLAAGQALRLVALTGYGSPADAEQARRSGFDGYLVKPASLDGLLGEIERGPRERQDVA